MSEMYYNSEIKENYLTAREVEYKAIRSIMRTFFNITKEYEEMYGKDCSNFTTTEILNMFSSCSTRSWEQLLNFNSQLKIYTSWCIKECLVNDNQNHYEEIDKTDLYNCLNLGVKEKMILSREELLHTIRDFPNISDQFLALALFEGISGAGYQDFYLLTEKSFTDNSVKLQTRELIVSSTLIDMAEQSADEYTKYDRKGVIRLGYKQNDPCVIKDSVNSKADSIESNTRKIQRRLLRLEKDYGKAFSYAGLKNSGRIDMIRSFMKEDNSTDVRETYDKHKEEIEFRYGKLQRVYRWIEENKQFFAIEEG